MIAIRRDYGAIGISSSARSPNQRPQTPAHLDRGRSHHFVEHLSTL
jgi:hypothetical protein